MDFGYGSAFLRITLLEPLCFPVMPLASPGFVATEAASADILGIGVDDFVISHLAVTVGCRTEKDQICFLFSQPGTAFALTLTGR